MTIQHEKRREHRASITSRGIVPWFAALVLVLVGAAGCRKTDVASSQAMRTDQQIATDIQAKYASESALNGQNVQVAVQSGVATLNGTVTDNASRALAGNDAGSVAGVKTVVNDLTVVSAAAVSVPPPIPPQQAVVEMDRRPLSARDSSMRPVSHRQRIDQSRQPAVQAQAPLPQPAQVAEEAAVVPAVPAPSAVQAPVETPRPERPAPVTVTLVPGTVVPVRITESLDSGQTQPGEVFHGTLAEDLIAGGMVAVPRGANIVGRVVDARDAGHFSGSSLLSIQLTEINAHGQTIAVATDTYTKQGQARGSNTAKKAGGGAALGAIIGAIAGGGKGAAIGAAAGGGIGAGANGVTRGQQVQIMPETLINFRLQIPAAVTTSRKLGSPQTDEQDVPRPTLQQR
ncbi:MAG TPA: BON domain-containing protein [Acidisarcina sp.]